jgi:hypothetical protein
MQFIELTPVHADLLLRARYAEMSRARHEKEGWPSQVLRDIKKRDKLMAEAIDKEVPLDQVERFVYRQENE